MTQPPKKRTGDTTVISGRNAGKGPKPSATQILSAAEARAIKRGGKRSGESSVILNDGVIRRQGLGVAVKFAVAISAILIAFMAMFVMVVSRDLETALNEEIDSAGVAAARALALPEYYTWNSFHRSLAGTSYAQFEEEVARGDKVVPQGALTKTQYDRFEKRRADNQKRLERILTRDDRILNALIYSPDRTKFSLQAGGDASLTFVGTPQPDREGVKIEYGTFRKGQANTVGARQYSAPIIADDGGAEGWATIVLSEKSISEKLAATQNHLAMLALVLIAIGVGVAFFMGRQITLPITQLTSDVEVIAKGDLEHHPRISTKDEIGVLGRTIERMARSLSAAQESEIEHAKQKHQLQVALEIQANLFPKELPFIPGYDVAAHYQAGPEVGGDYYDVMVLPDGRWLMMVAAASGKGIPAAMLTTMARSFITALAEREKSPQELLKAVNRLLSPDLRRGMYVTALMCLLDPKTGKIVFTNAGHNPLIYYSGEQKKVRSLHSDGIALGFDKGPVFDRTLREVEVELKVGDRIVLATPGLFGIKNADGQELGEARFYELVEREAGKDSNAFCRLVSHTVEKFGESGWMETDVTFVTLQRT